jgi:putative ABC transport system permease protein
MNLARITASYLRVRPLGTTLSVIFVALAIAAVALLLLTARQVERRIERDSRGIELVIGAGSPLQTVMSAVYQLGAPEGAIPWTQAEELMALAAPAKVIPLAMADNYLGYRVIGTTPAYAGHYGGVLSTGRLWEKPFEIVLGAEVAERTRAGIGSALPVAHGVGRAADRIHGEFPYRVVGTFGRTGTVLDQVAVTSLASVWAAHRQRHGSAPEDRWVTAIMMPAGPEQAMQSVLGALAGQTQLHAASPQAETARVLDMIGVGIEVLRVLAFVLVASAALAVFLTLYHALSGRRRDLAIMRALGASRERVMALLLFEGVLLALLGAVLGLVLGHVLASVVGHALARPGRLRITGWAWEPDELWVVALAIGVGFFAALLPAWRAHQADIAATLARG